MVVALLLACATPSPAPAEPLVGLAASSLAEVLPTLSAAWADRGGVPLTFGFDASSKLARQVEAGAPADVVFFADAESMDSLDGRGLLAPGTRRDIAGNTLVLVTPTAAAWTPGTPLDLADPALGHLAVAGENVPAGRYAREALQAAGVWSAVEGRVVAGDNVRTTLAWVTRGEAEAGVVYATDARVEPGVRVAFVFPPGSHRPIVYPAAVVAGGTRVREAAGFLDFCSSPAGRAILAEAGFAPPPAP